MKKTLVSVTTLLTLSYGSIADAKKPNLIMDGHNDQNERALVLAANTGIGALVGCIGAEISGDGCLEGLWRGMIGGSLNYVGMEIGSHNAELPFTGLMGRLVNNLGSSIVANAAYSRDFLGRFETEFGPLLLSFDNEKGFHAYIMPIATCAIAYNVFLGHKLNIIESLEDGTVSFNLDDYTRSFRGDDRYSGYATSVIPAYINNVNRVRSHENIHTYQISRFRWVDEFMPNIWILRYGSELVEATNALPQNLFGGDVYKYSPTEIEAFTMER